MPRSVDLEMYTSKVSVKPAVKCGSEAWTWGQTIKEQKRWK